MFRTAILALAMFGLTPTMAQVIARGKALYVEAQFAEAIATFDEALAHADASAGERREILLYLGFSQIGLGNEEAARRRFRDVLSEQPDAVLPPGTSPKIRDLFERVRGEIRALPVVEAAQPFVGPSPFGAGQRVRFKTRNVGSAQRVLLYWRGGALNVYSRVPLDVRPDGSAAADLDTRLLGATTIEAVTIEYFVEVRDGMLLKAQLGDPDHAIRYMLPATVAPQTVAAASARNAPADTAAQVDTPLYKRWWLWTIVGAVVVGGAAVGTYFGVSALQQKPTKGALDVAFGVQP